MVPGPVEGSWNRQAGDFVARAQQRETASEEEIAMGFRQGMDRRSVVQRVVVLGWVAAVAVACSGSAASAPQGAAAEQPRPAASAAPASGQGVSDGGGGSQPGGNGNGNGNAVVDDTKIVRTGALQITVADTDRAVSAARDAIRGLGGYIGASEQTRDDDRILATVTYRIPVARWEDALDALRRLGTEVGEQTQAVEVTGQLVDLDARIRNLKASEAALVGYVEKAPKVSDLLEIEARLTDTRGEIERLTAEQAALADKAAMATLAVTFGTEVVAVTEAAAKWDPAAEVDRATASLLSVGQGLVSFLIVFAIVWLPILAVLAAIAGIGIAVARRMGWRRGGGLPPAPPLPPAPAASTASGSDG